jgi:hypothetical protein
VTARPPDVHAALAAALCELEPFDAPAGLQVSVMRAIRAEQLAPVAAEAEPSVSLRERLRRARERLASGHGPPGLVAAAATGGAMVLGMVSVTAIPPGSGAPQAARTQTAPLPRVFTLGGREAPDRAPAPMGPAAPGFRWLPTGSAISPNGRTIVRNRNLLDA